MTHRSKEWNVVDILNWGTEYFREKQVPAPRLSIEWLLAEVLDVKRLNLYMQFDRPLAGHELEQLRPLIKRRARHEPLQYITGYAEFYGLKIEVNRDVLIPRPETELLVEKVISDNESSSSCHILDVGTGSGCIALALKNTRPDWTVWATEICERALQQARHNSRSLGIDIQLLQKDFDQTSEVVPGTAFDLIVSNPPYVLPEEKQELESQIWQYEPETALFTRDTERTYRNLITLAENNLNKGGKLYLELHENLAERVSHLFQGRPWKTQLLTDYSNKQRFLRGFFHGQAG